MQMPARGLRVAHVFAGTEGGSWVFDQLRALREEHGCEAIAVLGGPEGTLPDKCRASGIPVKALDFGTGNIFTLTWRIWKFALWLRRERIDVVQSHVMNSTMLARPAAWLADVPVRLTMVTGPYYMQSPGFRRAELRTCQIETGIVPSCELTARLYRDAGVPGRLICETLYYGPSAALWNPGKAQPCGLRARFGLAEDALLIGVVAMFYQPMPPTGDYTPPGIGGRMVKGHDDLIAAMPLILAEFPAARMLFIGQGWGPLGKDCEDEIRQMIVTAGMEQQILMTGYIADIAGAYLDIDVSVQASLNENLGGTVESLLMARPTVATRVGGMVDAVIDGETGVLVQPSDPADLARGICDMLRNPERARLLGEAGRRHMLKGFTLEITVPGLAALYARQRAAASGAWRFSVMVQRAVTAPVRFFPVLAAAIGPLLNRVNLSRALYLVYRYALHYGTRMVPGPIRRALRKIMRIERKPHPGN
jgi:glycosyltransferase involved in cell wall biosynthesis